LDLDLPDAVTRSTKNVTYIDEGRTRVYGDAVITCDE